MKKLPVAHKKEEPKKKKKTFQKKKKKKIPSSTMVKLSLKWCFICKRTKHFFFLTPGMAQIKVWHLWEKNGVIIVKRSRLLVSEMTWWMCRSSDKLQLASVTSQRHWQQWSSWPPTLSLAWSWRQEKEGDKDLKEGEFLITIPIEQELLDRTYRHPHYLTWEWFIFKKKNKKRNNPTSLQTICLIQNNFI